MALAQRRGGIRCVVGASDLRGGGGRAALRTAADLATGLGGAGACPKVVNA